MIRFSCVCGEKFEVPSDCAGDEMQCPVCRRLVDVPRLGEIDALANDGTVKLAEAEAPESKLEDQIRIYGHRQDIRQSVDEFLLVGEEDSSPKPPARLAPRYDPETGELVTEIPVKEDIRRDRPQDIPMATPTLNYSSAGSGRHAKGEIRWYEMPWRLLTGQNLIAMAFVFAAHVLIHFIMLVPVLNLLFIPIAGLIFLMIVAHYCNMIEEFGPHHTDHIPVMLRNVSFSEDIVHPLYSVGLGILFAFGPAIVLALCGLGPRSTVAWPFWTMMAYGAFVFLAGVFTAICSGALQNMLPQHAMAIVRVAPVRYLLALLAFAVGLGAYAGAIGGLVFTNVSVLTSASGPALANLAVAGGIAYAFFALAVYSMHLCGAWLGLIYRTHYERFGWVLQRFEKAGRTDTNARLAEMRRSGDPRLNRGRNAVAAQRVATGQGTSPVGPSPTQSPDPNRVLPPLAKPVSARSGVSEL